MSSIKNFLVWMITFTLFTLAKMQFLQYHTKYLINNDDHTCLYRYANELRGRARHLVPYCIRTSITSQIPMKSSCYGKNVTFVDLKRNNISAEQLLKWFAPVDLISDYQEFLAYGFGENEIFCNCSQSDRSFGMRCQYTMLLIKSSFTELVDAIFAQKKKDDIRILTEANDVTCYELFNCTTYTGFCLDWRQICDSRIDCFNGRDEEHCLEKELSECDEKTEYRCMSGHCIPRIFLFDLTPDCPDWDDEQNMFFVNATYEECFRWALSDCEEHSCGLSSFSCGDGQCVNFVMAEVYAQLCHNHRDALFIKRLYVNQNQLSDNSWHFFLCNTYLSCLFELPDVSNSNCHRSGDQIAQFCYDIYGSLTLYPVDRELFFLTSPIVYPSVQLLYKWKSFELSPFLVQSSMKPIGICYNASAYGAKPLILDPPQNMVRGLNCYNPDIFNIQSLPLTSDSITYLTLLVIMMQQIFSQHSKSPLHPQLYSCKNGLQISRHRLKDGRIDCYPDNGDEVFEIETCRWNLTDRFECLFEDAKQRTCIPKRLIHDGYQDCVSLFDEFLPFPCTYEYDCQFLRRLNLSTSFPLVYEELCNGVTLSLGNITTDDEIDCNAWPCQTRAHRCDGVWNRPNGCDELNCPGLVPTYLAQTVANCSIDEHYCLQYNQTILKCLPFTQAGDGKIDCLFAMDERLTQGIRLNVLAVKDLVFYRENYGRCLNSEKNVRFSEICDQTLQCPLHDDELLCPWNSKNTCFFRESKCKNGICIQESKRCDGQIDCHPEGDDEWGCDLNNVKRKDGYRPFTLRGFDIEPDDEQISSLSVQVNSNNIYSKPDKLVLTESSDKFHCHRGILLRSKESTNVCLCPPSYHGDRCQHQSERLSITFRSEMPVSFDQDLVYQLIFVLLNDNFQVLNVEIILHMPSKQSTLKHLIYFVYPRSKYRHLNGDLFVHIEAYTVTSTEVQSLSLAWYYKVQFPFLPVNRLSLTLDLEPISLNKTLCHQLGCIHGLCTAYINRREKHFCSCHRDWSGPTCNQIVNINPCTQLNCDVRYSKCVIYGDRAVCICTLGRIGHNCRVPYHACNGINCKNGGQCMSLDERSLKKTCLCPVNYYGNECQFKVARLTIQIPSIAEFFPVLVVHFLHTSTYIPGVLSHRNTYFFKNIHPNMEIIVDDYQQEFLPSIITVQTFVSISSLYGSYYLLALIDQNRTRLTKTLSLENRCIHVSEELPLSIMNLTWIKRVKFYHIYFKKVRCFYDELYMCFVDRDLLIDCLLFNHEVADCTDRNYCENGGRCLQKKQGGQVHSACVCPECHYGSFCQLTMTRYSLTLDSMFGQEIITDASLSQQKLFIKIMFTFVVLIFFIGITSNVCSTLTFLHRDIRRTGCGCYLLTLSIASQISLAIFICRFIYLLMSQMTTIPNGQFLSITCILFDFLLQLSISFCDWLSTCVACERVVSVLKGITFDKPLSARVVKFIIPALLIGLILTSIHQVFNRELISDPRLENRLWCVIKLPVGWLRTYDVVMNLLNSILPFLINLISAILLLVAFSHTKRKVAKKNYLNILKKQIREHKDLIVSPVMMISCKLPLLIVILIIQCIKSKWQLYLSTACYFLSLVPLLATFPIFILTAPSYLKTFSTMRIKVFRRH